ncbi:MAG: hypothetical protein HYY59_07655 [Candidatus Omnitrophica bacterium]|nr:hypothetical protein [Candidatus Omnitrophota bacterium]
MSTERLRVMVGRGSSCPIDMNVFPAEQNRQAYFEAQITHADRKFRYCKVSVDDVWKYRAT